MDDKNYEIFVALNKNGRVPVSHIAKEIGLSVPSTKERLDAMIKSGEVAVKGLINASHQGWKIATCLVRVKNMVSAVELADRFKRCPRAIFVSTLTGRYNLMLILAAKNTVVLETSIENDIRKIPSVKEVNCLFGEAPIRPDFVDAVEERKLEKKPCDQGACTDCYLYGSQCDGCPATVFCRASSAKSPRAAPPVPKKQKRR